MKHKWLLRFGATAGLAGISARILRSAPDEDPAGAGPAAAAGDSSATPPAARRAGRLPFTLGLAVALSLTLLLGTAVAGQAPLGLPTIGLAERQAEPAPADESESPHGPIDLATDKCATCHASHTAVESGLLTAANDEASQNQICTSCHGPSGGAEQVSTHSNKDFGGATQEPFYELCTGCHDPHSTPNDTAGDGINDHLITTTIGPFTVRLDAESGEDSYDDGFDDGEYDSVCVVCHTSTAHNTNTSTELLGEGHDPVGSGCMSCHSHGDDPSMRSGFMPVGGEAGSSGAALAAASTATSTATAVASLTPTATLSATATASSTPPPTVSLTPTATPIPSPTLSPAPSPTPSPTPSATPTPTASPTASPTPSASPTASPSPAPTPVLSPHVHLDEEEDTALLGNAAGGRAGSALATGDVNGDGKGDLIIGAPNVDVGESKDVGKTYVIFGRTGLPSTLDLTIDAVDLIVTGRAAGDRSGSSVQAADLNGDGTDDLIIGAPGPDPAESGPSEGRAGETYVIYGGDGLPSTIDLASTSADVTMTGGASGGRSGSALATGDLNGDGRGDLIVAAPYADTPNGRAAGATYAVFGETDLPPVIDLSSSADFTVYGRHSYDYSGSAVASADLNRDGADDLVVGAPGADASGEEAGETYVIYCGPELSGTRDLAADPADATVTGGAAHDQSGRALAAGDMNGDGGADLAIGAPGADAPGRSGAGAVYVFYGGGPDDGVAPTDSGVDFVLIGDDELDRAGDAIALGDVSGDGIGDLIVGAPAADPAASAAAGETYVIRGRDDLPPVLDLDTDPADLVIFGGGEGDRSGSAVVAGDINGDRVLDLIIGAPGADRDGRDETGAVYAIYGHGQPAPTPTPAPTSTATATASATASSTASPTASATPTSTPSPTDTPTPSPVPADAAIPPSEESPEG